MNYYEEKDHVEKSENEVLEAKKVEQGLDSYEKKKQEYEKKRQEQEKINAKQFVLLGIPGIIYAVLFAFCLYDNASGITNPIWAAANVGYIYFVVRKLNVPWKKINTFTSSAIILFGISNYITDNETTMVLNYCMIFLLTAVCVIYCFYEDKELNVTAHLGIILQSIFCSISEWVAPIVQPAAYLKSLRKNKKKSANGVYVLIGIVISIPIVVIVVTLLASADMVFKEMFSHIAEAINLDFIFENMIPIGFMLAIGYVLPYAYIKYVQGKKMPEPKNIEAKGEPIIASIVAGAISVLYILFSVIQIVYLFMGKGNLPQEYTYAEYAKKGFYELLFVCILNFVIVIIGMEHFRKSKILNKLMTIICGCTFIVVISSVYRMLMYIDAYGLTYIRVFALWGLAVITLVMIGVILGLFKEKFPLFNYCMIVVTSCYLIFSFSHTDYFVAKYDLEKYEKIKEEYSNNDELNRNYVNHVVDYHYLMTLSMDAVPAIVENREEINKFIKEKNYHEYQIRWVCGRYDYCEYYYYNDYDENYEDEGYDYDDEYDNSGVVSEAYKYMGKESWRHFNISRAIAKKLIQKHEIIAIYDR